MALGPSLALALLLAVASGAWAQDPEGHLSPDYPMQYYWFRTDLGVPGPMVAADPRLAEMAAALSAGQLAHCHELAQALLDSADVPDLQAEASSYLVESYLAEGDFAGARAAAKRTGDTESLARVNKLEAAYNAEVNRLQRVVATTQDAEVAAWAQLRLARVSQTFGQDQLAYQAYGRVISQFPLSAAASAAIASVAMHYWKRGESDAAIAACEHAIDVAPDYPLGVRACRLLFRPYAGREVGVREATRVRLRAIAERHPGTLASEMARLGIGQLYLADGMPEQAEREWAALTRRSPGSAIRSEAEASLLELRYDLGMAASEEENYSEAVRWLAPMVWETGYASRDGWKPSAVGTRTVSIEKQEIAVFRLAQAYQHLQQWDKAADTFSLIATADSDEFEGTAIPLAESLYEANRWDEARQVLAEFMSRLPEPDLVVRADELLRRMEPEEAPE